MSETTAKALAERKTAQAAIRELTQLGPAVRQLGEVLSSQNAMIVAMAEELTALRAQMAQLEKLTPLQTREMNRKIRERSAALAERYGLADWREVGRAIRHDMRIELGIPTVSQIARCDLDVAGDLVDTWEEPEAIRKMRRAQA